MKGFRIAVIVLVTMAIGISAWAEPRKGRIEEATGSAALAQTFTPTNQAYLTNVRLHLSAAATQESFSVYIDSAKGAAYDTVLYTVSLVGVTDVSWAPSGRVLINAGDSVKLAWTNTDTRTWGTEIGYEY